MLFHNREYLKKYFGLIKKLQIYIRYEMWCVIMKWCLTFLETFYNAAHAASSCSLIIWWNENSQWLRSLVSVFVKTLVILPQLEDGIISISKASSFQIRSNWVGKVDLWWCFNFSMTDPGSNQNVVEVLVLSEGGNVHIWSLS